MHRANRIGCGILALALFASVCYGPFNLTRRLCNWNGQVGTKWEKEFVFILLAWLPVYGLTVLGDGVVFNSMEFWTGNNPVDPPKMKRSSLPQTKRVARGNTEALLTYAATPAGSELLVEQFQHSQPAGSLRIQQRNGMTVGFDGNDRMLFTATTLGDGSVIVTNVKTQQVASYSSDQVEHFLSSAQQ